MTSPLRSGLRVLRAAGVAAVVVSLAAGAHVAGHGELPAPGLLAVLAVLVAFVATVATRRRLGPVALVTLLGASQVALHQAMSWLSSPACAPVPAAGHLAHAASHAAATTCASMPTMDGAPSTGLLMMLAHVVATVASALLLASAEGALWALLSWLRPLRRARPVVVLVAPRSLPVPGRLTLLPHQPPLRPSALRRGPPGSC